MGLQVQDEEEVTTLEETESADQDQTTDVGETIQGKEIRLKLLGYLRESQRQKERVWVCVCGVCIKEWEWKRAPAQGKGLKGYPLPPKVFFKGYPRRYTILLPYAKILVFFGQFWEKWQKIAKFLKIVLGWVPLRSAQICEKNWDFFARFMHGKELWSIFTEIQTESSGSTEELTVAEEITEEISSVAPELFTESDSLNLLIPVSETTSESSGEANPSDCHIFIWMWFAVGENCEIVIKLKKIQFHFDFCVILIFLMICANVVTNEIQIQQFKSISNVKQKLGLEETTLEQEVVVEEKDATPEEAEAVTPSITIQSVLVIINYSADNSLALQFEIP